MPSTNTVNKAFKSRSGWGVATPLVNRGALLRIIGRARARVEAL